MLLLCCCFYKKRHSECFTSNHSLTNYTHSHTDGGELSVLPKDSSTLKRGSQESNNQSPVGDGSSTPKPQSAHVFSNCQEISTMCCGSSYSKCNKFARPLEGKTLQETEDVCQRCYSPSRMWSRLLPLQIKTGDLERGFFWKGECEPSSRPASPLIIVSKENGKNP